MSDNLIVPKFSYCDSLTEYSRRKTIEVKIGSVGCGGNNPIRLQSMTTTDTMDTWGTVAQSIRMIEAGCEYVRITAPSVNEAQNLKNIKDELVKRGYHTPLIADIHFTPNAAEVAARLIEKVRVNPGNYADKKKFEIIDYTDSTYQIELERIRDKFLPLVNICKEYGTAMRIGTNHGSLSDRILSRYGDTPLGMVESALEFLRICEAENYYNIVISMKASNTQVMVQAYRLLVAKLQEEGLKAYPLHLGVTEAGEAEDGRIKSAVGIGTLLEDGLGDTVRVSLTEPPEFEIPVAKALVDRYNYRVGHKPIKNIEHCPINPFQYIKRTSTEVQNLGNHNVPRVIVDLSKTDTLAYEDLKHIGHFYYAPTDKWNMNDLGADYIYSGDHPISFMLPNGLKEIINFNSWVHVSDKSNKFPLFDFESYMTAPTQHAQLNFVRVNYKAMHEAFYTKVKNDPSVVLILESHNTHTLAALRRLSVFLIDNNIKAPLILSSKYENIPDDNFQLYSATDLGGLLIDGIGDGIFISTELLYNLPKDTLLQKVAQYNTTSFGILQAARTRMSKAEYISCPSCGRTLFDLQETTAMIRKRTDHLKGVKIGIMGCIVNGPGEMADADYGYVGVGKDKIALYKGQTVIKKAVPAASALDELIELIKQDGRWPDTES